MANLHRWTQIEIQLLKEGVKQFDQDYRMIQQKLLPHISAKIIKTRYYNQMREKKG